MTGFHQGKKFFGVKGTDLKGMNIIKKERETMCNFVVKKKNADGDQEKKSIRYKSVFAKSDFEVFAIARNREFLTQIGK